MLKLSLRAALALALSVPATAQVGAVIGSFQTPAGAIPVGLGVDTAGNLFLTSSARMVYQLDTAGNVLASWSAATNTGIANGITSDGTNFYVTDASPILGGRGVDVYDLQGNYQRTFAVPASFPAGICWDPTTNHLFIVDRIGSSTVYEYDLAGTQIGSFTLTGTTNDGVTHDPATNSFWVYEGAGDACRNYDATWTETGNFPGPNAAIGSAGRGCALLSGILYVVAPAARQVVLFDTTGTLASVSNYGRGCPLEPTVYEVFAAGQFDLQNQSFLFRPNGVGGWAVSSCTSNCFDATIGADLFLGDDQLSINHALGFTFPMPGSPYGSTTAIDISSNGFIFLRTGATTEHGCCDGDPVRFLSGPERISALWMDLDPSQSGGTHFRTAGNRAIITWNRVPEIGQRTTNTAQIQLFSNGDFLLSYQGASNVTHTMLAGYSSGNDAYDSGSIDLSATVPFSTGINGPRLALDSDRPILGSSMTYRVTQIPGNATLAALLFGSAAAATPLDAIGMNGCSLLTTADLASAPMSLPAGTFTFSVPSSTSLIGAQVYQQAVLFARGLNVFGAITSNGILLKLGT